LLSCRRGSPLRPCATGRAEPAVWAVYPPKKIVSSKVRAFVDFYAEAIGEPPYWDDGLAPALRA
jgi:DNA-binding transcriptional LysR family regulator